MIEVTFELGELRVQALPSDRPSPFLGVVGCQRCRGPVLSLQSRHSLKSGEKPGGRWLTLSSDSFRPSWWKRAEQYEACLEGFLKERLCTGLKCGRFVAGKRSSRHVEWTKSAEKGFRDSCSSVLASVSSSS